MWGKLKKKRYLIPIQVSVAIVLCLSLLLTGTIHIGDITSDTQTIGMGQKTISIGVAGVAYAAGTPDYACDGVADDVQFQLAFNALPATGGKIVVLGGVYSFNATVTRAIDNITVQGMGFSSFISRDGINPIFTIGAQSNWTFMNLRLDAGGVSDALATEVTYENVDVGGTHWAYDTSIDIGGASWDVPTGRGATLIVAASDAYANSIAQADYICDGTADDVQIQAALDALPASGGTVQLTEGNFVTAADISVPTNTLLRGEGHATILTAGGGAITRALLINGDNVTVRDMRVMLAAGAGGGGTRPNVIFADTKNRLLFDNLWVVGDNTVADDGSNLRQIGIQLTFCQYSKIVNCRIESNVRYGIQLFSGSTYNVVANNTVYSNSDYGIHLRTTCSYNTITGNSCYGNTLHGIYFATNVNRNTVIGNVSTANSNCGLVINNCHDNVITGNNFSSNTVQGLEVQAGSTNNTITGNTCANNDSGGVNYNGIYINASDYNTISGNTVNDNGLHGINITRSDYNVVSGNNIENQNTGDGIYVFGDGGGNSDYNVVTGNISNGNGDDGIEVVGAANANDNILDDNNVVGNTGTAIVDAGTSTQIRNNKGFVTENSGTATLLNANTSVVVAHGLDVTPTVILITFAENPTNLMADWWVDNVGAANFTFNGVDPGASNLDFYWEAKAR